MNSETLRVYEFPDLTTFKESLKKETLTEKYSWFCKSDEIVQKWASEPLLEAAFAEQEYDLAKKVD